LRAAVRGLPSPGTISGGAPDKTEPPAANGHTSGPSTAETREDHG
jgi:hypothetical protein